MTPMETFSEATEARQKIVYNAVMWGGNLYFQSWAIYNVYPLLNSSLPATGKKKYSKSFVGTYKILVQ